MDAKTETIAAARVIYHQLQDQALASSPLSAMGEWIRSGAAPSAGLLRAAGLNAESERQDIRLARRAFIRRWGVSLPCGEAVAALRRLNPVVAVGAGRGAWAGGVEPG